MKKLLMILLIPLLLVGCGSEKTEKINLSKNVTISFYSVVDCGECKAFKKIAIPYFKEVFGDKVTIKMYDMDADSTTKPYNASIKRLKDFDEEYYGMGPYIDVEGSFAYLGYEAGNEKIIAKDIAAFQKNKTLSSSLEGSRFLYK